LLWPFCSPYSPNVEEGACFDVREGSSFSNPYVVWACAPRVLRYLLCIGVWSIIFRSPPHLERGSGDEEDGFYWPR
jgi:hypothetical protein